MPAAFPLDIAEIIDRPTSFLMSVNCSCLSLSDLPSSCNALQPAIGLLSKSDAKRGSYLTILDGVLLERRLLNRDNNAIMRLTIDIALEFEVVCSRNLILFFARKKLNIDNDDIGYSFILILR